MLGALSPECMGFRSTWAWELWLAGLAALWHVGSSWTRNPTRVSYVGRWIPIHCTTREVSLTSFLSHHPLYPPPPNPKQGATMALSLDRWMCVLPAPGTRMVSMTPAV